MFPNKCHKGGVLIPLCLHLNISTAIFQCWTHSARDSLWSGASAAWRCMATTEERIAARWLYIRCNNAPFSFIIYLSLLCFSIEYRVEWEEGRVGVYLGLVFPGEGAVYRDIIELPGFPQGRHTLIPSFVEGTEIAFISMCFPRGEGKLFQDNCLTTSFSELWVEGR